MYKGTCNAFLLKVQIQLPGHIHFCPFWFTSCSFIAFYWIQGEQKIVPLLLDFPNSVTLVAVEKTLMLQTLGFSALLN